MSSLYYSVTRTIQIADPTLKDFVKRFEIAKLGWLSIEDTFTIVDEYGKEHIYSKEFAIQDTGDELAYMLHTNSAKFSVAFSIVYSNLFDGVKPHAT